MRKRRKPGGANYFLREKHEVFANKNCKKRIFTKKRSMVVCSVFEITENENPKKGFEQTESTNKDFLTIKKMRCCVPILFKEKKVFLYVEKWTIERKRCYKK